MNFSLTYMKCFVYNFCEIFRKPFLNLTQPPINPECDITKIYCGSFCEMLEKYCVRLFVATI